ncbi:MAG: glutathione S-transferase family protein [Pseudomonadota bacterium]
MYTLYSMQSSGNCYKCRLTLSQCELPYTLEDVDIREGATRTPDFLAINPNGKVPVLALPDGRTLAESNAILVYLAHGSPLLPEERFERAKVMEWLFFEQYSHEPYIAVARYWLSLHPGGREMQAARISDWLEHGHRALGVMERHLDTNGFFVGGRYTIADTALYAYTHVAEDGDFELERYPAIRAWFERVKAQPRHVTMDTRPA